MDEETKRQAVEPFFTTKPIEAGTGLGLTMVHDFARQCGGELRIESEVGVGTTIRTFLPVNQEDEHRQPRGKSEDSLRGGSETILVVEDREGVRRFACRTLRRLGYRTYEAKDADIAKGVLKNRTSIDLVFSDIVMPEMDGIELAQRCNEISPATKVMFITGFAAVTLKASAEQPHAKVLSKPFHLRDLVFEVERVLGGQVSAQLL